MHSIFSVRLTRILTTLIPLAILMGCGEGDGKPSIAGTPAPPPPPPPPASCNDFVGFEDVCPAGAFTEFEGGVAFVVDNPDATGINTSAKVAQMQKFLATSGATFGGTTLALPTSLNVTAGSSFTMKVWSQRAVVVLFQPEPQGPGNGIEVTHGGSGWEELTFSLPAISGTVDGITIIFDNGTLGDADNDALNWTFYVDEITLLAPGTGGGGGGGGGAAPAALPVDFEGATDSYDFGPDGGFEGGAASVVVNPDQSGINTSGQVGQMQKFPGEVFGGATLVIEDTTVTAGSSFTMKVWSQRAVNVLFQPEPQGPGSEVEVAHGGTGWEELTFDFPSLAGTVSGLTIIFDNGTAGAADTDPTNWTFYFDDIVLVPPGGGGGGTGGGSALITFDDPGVTYTLIGFGGAEASTVVADPTDGTNQVAEVVKSNIAELWAGTTVATGANESIADLPLDATNTQMTVRVWSPDAGIPVRLKVENASDPTLSVETEATTTMAGAWETLTFDFANEAAGTQAFNPATTYNKVSIFFNFGTTGADAGEKTYYFDDIDVVAGTGGGGGGTGGGSALITFDDPGVTYTLIGFGGAEASTVVADPTDGTNQVAEVVKSNIAELWAGTTVATGANESIADLPLDATNTQMTVRVWSPDAGIPVRLKVENASDPTLSVETEATTTMAGAWETLTFDFANEAAGTQAFNPATTYNKVSIFFNFGTTGADAGEKTYYFDDIDVVSGGGTGGGGGGSASTDFESGSFTFNDFDGGVASVIANPDVSGINTSGQVGEMQKFAGQPWGGSTLDLGGAVAFAAGDSYTMKVRASREVDVTLKLEPLNEERIATHSGSGTWEELCFDFTGVSGDVTGITLIFDNGTQGDAANNPADWTFQFDDIAQTTDACPTGGGGGSGFAPITFDDPAVTYTLTGFGGAEGSVVTNDPAGGTNMVAQAIKSATAELWAGTTVSTEANEAIQTIPLDAANTQMTVRVYSPDAGIPVRLKIENASDPTLSVETEAMTTMAGAWETLTFDFANEAAGTSAFNPATTYNKVSIFFNFGTDGATAGEKTYYFDDIDVVSGGGTGGGGTGGGTALITFDDAAVTYTLIGFGGAEDSTVVADPTDPTNMVAQAVKSDTAELWAGTTVATGANESIPDLPLDAANTQMTVRVWTPNAGIQVRLKVETAGDPTRSVETEATTTMSGAWETLTFDFANEAAGTPAFDPTYTYNKISIFFNFGVDGASGGGGTYYFDDIDAVSGGGTGGGGGTSANFVNGDFETGDFTGWTQFQDPPGGGGSIAVDTSMQGGRAGTVARLTAAGSDVVGTNDVIISQVALAAGTISAGDTIDVSFDLYGSLTGAGGVVFVEVIFLDGAGSDNGRDFVGPAAPYTPTGMWTTHSGTVTAGTPVNGGSASVDGGVTLELKVACGAIVGGCGVDASFDNVTFTIN